MIIAIIIVLWLLLGYVITAREINQGVYTMPTNQVGQFLTYVASIIVNPLFTPVVLIEIADRRRNAH
jgi:hypothetical protein